MKINKLMLSLAMVLSFAFSISANETYAESYSVFTHDSIAARYMSLMPDYQNIYGKRPRKDINGKDCALLRIFTSKESNISFNGNIVGEYKYVDYAYWIYMTNGSRMLQIQDGDSIINLDLCHMINNCQDGLNDGVSYSLCGLDNDDYLTIGRCTELYRSEDVKLLRDFAHEYIDAFNNRDLTKFRRFYPDIRNILGNGDALSRIIDELEINDSVGYYVTCQSIDFHGAKPHIYGMLTKFYDKNESDLKGYSFLLLDLNDKGKVLNHFSTYQTAKEVEVNGMYTFDDFFIP